VWKWRSSADVSLKEGLYSENTLRILHMVPFRVAGRLVEPSLNRIDGAQIEPKIIQVLVALAARPGDVVTREELMTLVWGDVFVTDDVLNRAIREIRRLFADDAERPRVVETIRKRGYRLVAPVEQQGAQSKPTALTRDTSWTPGPIAIAMMLGVAMLAGAALVWLGVGRGGSVTTEARLRFTPLTSDPGNEYDPALSPDGEQLAYVARGPDGATRIFVKPTHGGSVTQITSGNGHDTAPAWSPDGAHVAYAHMDDGQCVIRIADAFGASSRAAGPCGSRETLKMSWSADARRLAIAARKNNTSGPFRIELVDLESGARQPVSDPPEGIVGDDSPAFSPDGRSIAFLRSISGAIGDIFVMSADGRAARRVTTDNADVIGIDWEPDGRSLVFSSDRAGGISMFRVPVAGGEPTLVTGGGTRVKHPAVASRAGAIAYEDWHYEINIVDVALRGGERRPISPTTDQWNFHPQISPDGSKIAFQSTRSGPYEIWVADRDGSNAVQITSSGGYKSMPRWSPDGRSLVFVTRVEEVAQLVIVDVATRRVHPVTTDTGGLAAPSFTHDGASVYFASPRSGSWQTWRMPVAGGAAQQVTTEGGYAALESPDGQWLYLSRFDRKGLWRRPTSGGAEQVVSLDVAPEDWPNWGVTDSGAFFVTRPDDEDPVLMVAENGAAPRMVTRLAEHAWSGVAMSRDGSHVLYAHADHRDSNIVGIQFVR